MQVFIVLKITDFEYGCRSIEAVFNSLEDAEAYIESTGDQYEVNFWTGSKTMFYSIEVYEVR